MQVRSRLAVLVETGADGNQQLFGVPFDDHFRAGAHARAQSRIEILQCGARRESLGGGRPAAEYEDRDRADEVQVGGEFLVGNGVHADTHRLAELQLAALHFVELQIDIQFAQVGDFGDFGAVPHAVAFAERRRRLAETSRRTEIGEQIDHPIGGRAELHHAQIAVGRVEISHGLVLLLAQAEIVGVVTHQVRVDVGLHLLQAAFLHAHGDAVLLAVDGVDHLGLAGIELGAFHAIFGRHLIHGVGIVIDALGGVQLVDGALNRLHLEGLPDDVLLLLNAIELHHHFAALDE